MSVHDISEEKVEENQRVVDTHCRECVFAIFDSETDTKQSGCIFGMLEKFEKAGVTISEEFYNGRLTKIIEGRVCNKCRNSKWAAGKNLEQSINDAIKESTYSYDVVVLMTPSTSIENLVKTYNNVSSQKIPPKCFVVANISDIGTLGIVAKMKEIGNSCPWRVIDMSEAEKQEGINRWLELATRKSDAFAYTVLESGNELPNKYADYIDRYINGLVGRFAVLLPYDGVNGLTILNKARKIFLEDSKKTQQPLADYLVHVGTLTNTLHMVKKYEEICQAVQKNSL